MIQINRIVKLGIIFALVASIYIFLMENYELKYGPFRYEIVNESISITGIAKNKMDNLEILDRINEMPVTQIENKAFYGADNLTGEIIIPSTVSQIGQEAFINCSNIQSIKMQGDAPNIYSNTFDENIIVKYKYNTLGYDKNNWEIVITKPYDVPMDVIDVAEISPIEYNGEDIKVNIIAKFEDEILMENTDYILQFSDNKNVGQAKIKICGIGDYIGEKEVSFDIIPKNIETVEFSDVEDTVYTGKSLIPNITIKDLGKTLIADTDFSLEYKDNKNAGTANIIVTGKGNYTGTKKITFKINKVSINDVSIEGLANKAYTGSKIVQSLKITYNDITLKNGVDYTLSYSNNINLGTATVTVKGIGNFESSKTLTYKISARSVSTLNYSKVRNQLYTGSAITPSITVKYNGKTLKINKDYKISYKNNKNVGTGKIIITGIGNYTGTKEINFKIQKEEYYIKVNYKANVVTIYKGVEGNYNTPVRAMICSTGTYTPTSGQYTIKSKWTWLKLYGGVYGHYVTQITGDILFHSVPYLSKSPDTLEYWEYDKLGTNASLGCVRLTAKDAKWIYDNIPKGTIVEFYSSSNPGPLGKPSAMKITEYTEYRNWDPTDPSSQNPWKEIL